MLIDLSPAAYLALCGLVRDALEVKSDASPLLERLAEELSNVTAGGMVPAELTEVPSHIEALQRGGFMRAG